MRASCCTLPPSRSTAFSRIGEQAVALNSRYAAGSGERKERLHTALTAIGFPGIEVLLDSAEFRGSSALRIYSSFVLPRNDGALAAAEQPQRAAVIANSIAFMVREHRNDRSEWLRNHDRSLEEVADAPSFPLTLVLDNLRSAANVGNIFRAAEAARIEAIVCCGITPTPPQPKLLRTAMGSAEYVCHSYAGSTLEAVLGSLPSAGIYRSICRSIRIYTYAHTYIHIVIYLYRSGL